jgi:hypothetical protein
MMRLWTFMGGWGMGLLTAFGCASSPTFPWKFYTPSMPPTCYDEGQLLGKLGSDGWPDLSLDECKPDPMPSPGASPNPGPSPVLDRCMIMNTQDFYAMQAAYLTCQNDLIACQQGPAPQ